MKRLYHQLTVHHFGEPEDLWTYDPARATNPSPKLRLTYVAVWPADKKCDVTGFNTLGMSRRKMKGADYYTELHMGIRARLTKAKRERISGFLANVAQYPFDHNRCLDWWHVLNNPGTIPLFPNCSQLLFHPRLTPTGLDRIDDPQGLVKLLYVVPITPLEHHLLTAHGQEAFEEHVAENGIDLLSDRTDPK
jgi:hypothetical protein